MTILRKNTNPRAWDIAPQLQNTLNANGMQAHIAMTSTGEFQLVTLSHNTSSPRRYTLTEDQLEALRNGGTSVWDKKAYNTFVSIVKNDYYIPGSPVAARNANSPVNMGLNGHRLNPGEYGYRGEPSFHPFVGGRYGLFNNFLDGFGAFRRHGFHARRIDDRPYYANSAPIVMDRPDGRLKPGELKTGDYGFYDKGNQQQDTLANMKVDVQPKQLVRPKGQAFTLGEYLNGYSAMLTFSGDGFGKVLSSHGIVIDKVAKTLTIKSDGINKDLQYQLTADEINTILNDKLKFTQEKEKQKIVHNKTAPSISDRIDLINKVIEKDFADKITASLLQSKDYINIKLKPETERELNIGQQEAVSYANNLDVVNIDMREMRQDYKTGFIDKWNSIGVVDGRSLNKNEGFYLPVKNGRAMSVGEIQAYPTHDGNKTSFRMTAVINGQVMSHEISKEDYLKFINYDDEHRLKLFDKVFDEVAIKSASNGRTQDTAIPGNIEQAYGVVTMQGNYSLVSASTSAAITDAKAWKDSISGNYQINVRTNKDVGMWSFKITEAQYNAFKYATDDERAKMLTTLIPFKDENHQKMEVIHDAHPNQAAGLNTNNPKLVKAIHDLEESGLGYEPVKNHAQAGHKGKDGEVHYGKETINLNDLRKAVKISLIGDAGVNGESLENEKNSKEWKRSGEHGRSTNIGDITVERLKDAKGDIIEGKYKMTAVIDGNVITHEISQKDYNKFLAVNDYQRMRLFDKIFPEVEMKTKAENRFNLGAAILAAVTTGVGVVASLSVPPRPRPEIYGSGTVFHKPGVVSAPEISAALYESLHEQPGRGASEGMGMGR